MSLLGRLRALPRAAREYPEVRARLEAAQRELRQAQKTLERSEVECRRLIGDHWEAEHRLRSSEKKAKALQAALPSMMCYRFCKLCNPEP